VAGAGVKDSSHLVFQPVGKFLRTLEMAESLVCVGAVAVNDDQVIVVPRFFPGCVLDSPAELFGSVRILLGRKKINP
jgi:hypothetical protein